MPSFTRSAAIGRPGANGHTEDSVSPGAASASSPRSFRSLTSRCFGWLGRVVVRHRFAFIAAWVVLAISAGLFLPSINSAIESNDAALLPASAPSMKALHLSRPFGIEKFSTVLVVVHRSSGKLGEQDAAAVSALSKSLSRLPRVQGVEDAGMSANSKGHLLVVESSVSLFSSQDTASLVRTIDSKAREANLPSGLRVDVAGEIADTVASQIANQHRASRIEDAATLLILLLLVIAFRAVLAPILIFIPAALAVMVSQSLVAESARMGVQVSDFTQVLLIALVLGAGTDYGLFLGLRVREEMRRGAEFREAVVIAMRRVGESVAFSAVTVIVALLCLLFATFGMYRSLGVPLAMGVGVMLLAGLTLTPALLAAVGPVIFWPSKAARAGSRRPGRLMRGSWNRVARMVVTHPGTTLAAGLFVLGSLAVSALWVRPAGTQGALSAPPGSSAEAGDAAFAADWPGVSQSPTAIVVKLAHPVWSDPGQLVVLSRRLTHSKLFSTVLGPLDPMGLPMKTGQLISYHAAFGAARSLPAVEPARIALPSLFYDSYRATSQFVSQDGRTVQFEVSLARGAPLSTGALDEIPAVKSLAASAVRAVGGRQWGVTGQTAGVYDVSVVAGSDFWRVVPAVVVAIALLIGLLLRSAVAPLYLVASVTLSLFAALGIAVILFMGLGHQGGVFFMLPFALFLFLLALGEDYNILLMSRIRDEAQRAPLRVAVVRALSSTGATISSAGLVMAGTFGVLAFSGDPGSSNAEVQQVGVVLAIGILLDTFLVRSLVVPAVVTLLGRWNWWPSKLAERHTGRFERYGFHLRDLADSRFSGETAIHRATDRPGRILVLTASLGAGHDGVAHELRRRLESSGFDVEVHDFCDLLPAKVGKLIRFTFAAAVRYAPRAYNTIFRAWLDPVRPKVSLFAPITRLLASRISALARTRQPNSVVSTFNLCSRAAGDLRLRGDLEAPVASVVVDFYPHGAWLHPGVDLHLCLHESAAEVIRLATGGEVAVTGPTVRPPFRDSQWDRFVIRRGFGLDAVEKVVLVVGGSWGAGELIQTVRDLSRMAEVVPMVVCGSNGKLARAIEELFAATGKGVVLGWVKDLSPLMVAADVLVENAGGLTCMEALSLGLPVVSYRPIAGHGRLNVEAMASAGVVRHARSLRELRHEIHVVVGSARERSQMACKVAAMSRDGESASLISVLASGPRTICQARIGTDASQPSDQLGRAPIRLPQPTLAGATRKGDFQMRIRNSPTDSVLVGVPHVLTAAAESTPP